MTTKVRMGIAAAMLVAVASLIYVSGASYAGDDQAIKGSVVKVANAIKAKDDAGAKKAAMDAVKKVEDVEPIMGMFRPRKKNNTGGIGWGSTPLSNPAKDGIEVKLRELARDVPTNFAKEAAAAEEAGYWIAGIADLAKAKGFDKYSGKKSKKAWDDLCDEMREAGIGFAKAAAGKGGQQVKTAAEKANQVCTRCHNIFKE